MNEEQIFKQVDMVRQSTLKEMEGLSEEQADQIPEGFRNNIRWNLAHIYVTQHNLRCDYGGNNIGPLCRDLKMYAPGTKPADWEEEAQTLEEIKKQLEYQPAKLKEALSGQMDDEAEEAFMSLPTVGEILNF